VQPGATARTESEWLQEALQAMGVRGRKSSVEGVFREALPGYDYGKLGTLGVKTNGQHS